MQLNSFAQIITQASQICRKVVPRNRRAAQELPKSHMQAVYTKRGKSSSSWLTYVHEISSGIGRSESSRGTAFGLGLAKKEVPASIMCDSRGGRSGPTCFIDKSSFSCSQVKEKRYHDGIGRPRALHPLISAKLSRSSECDCPTLPR